MYELESVAGDWSGRTPCVLVCAEHCKLLMGSVCACMSALDDAYDGRDGSQ